MTTRYFFVATLMDPDVLRLALGRPVTRRALAPARLHGYRRMRILRDSFPVRAAHPPAAAEGLVFTDVGAQDHARILFVEVFHHHHAPYRSCLDHGTTRPAQLRRDTTVRRAS